MTARQWLFLTEAAATLLVVKLGLELLPFNKFRGLFARVSKHRGPTVSGNQYIQDTAWAVRTAARVLPISLTCLPQALAVKYLLRNQPDLVLNIGVQPSTHFVAHAWVEKAGQIVIGEWPEGKTYHLLWTWT